MTRSLALSILAIIGALFLATFTTSCTTVDDQSEHTKKVRAANTHSELMRRHRQRGR